MAYKEQDIIFNTKNAEGDTLLLFPITRLDNVEGALKTVNGSKPDAQGNIAINVDLSAVNTAISALKTSLATVDTKATDAATAAANAQTSANNKLSTSGGTITGALTVTGALKGATIQTTSDARLKEGIEDIYADLSSLKAKRYTLKADGEKHVGLIAQDVLKVLPEAVGTDKEGFYSLDYNAIVALLVDEVNSLSNRITVLERRVYGK